jgi:hypothetical protein
MTNKEPLISVTVDNPINKNDIASTTPINYEEINETPRRSPMGNRWLCILFIIFFGASIIFIPTNLEPTVVSSDLYITNGTILNEKTFDIWNPNYYTTKMSDPIIKQWFMDCDENYDCPWVLFGKYEYDGIININGRTNKLIKPETIKNPSQSVLISYTRKCLQNDLIVYFTGSWTTNGRRWTWESDEYTIHCT